MTHCGQMMDEGEDEEEEEDEEEQKKKRKRSSEEGDGMEEEEEDEGQPPKKQIRPNPDVTDPTPFQLPDSPQQRPQQQPADRNGYTARCESRPTFFLVIYTFLPSTVNRLLSLSRRSESGEADRLFLIHRQRQYLVFPDDVERKKTLTQRLSHLLTSAGKLLHHHHHDARGPQHENAAAGDSGMTANAQRLHQVTSDAIMLTEQHLEMLKFPDAFEEHRQRRYLEEIRLIIYDAVFLDHRLQEAPLERQGSGRYDMKVRDAWELVKLVCVEMRQVLDYLEELNKWISTYTPPPPDAAMAPAEQSVRGEAIAVVDRLAKFCHEKLADQLEFLTSRSNMAASASERPLYPDRMQGLDSLEVTTGFVWRSSAKNLAERCERLLEFFERNIRILEQ